MSNLDLLGNQMNHSTDLDLHISQIMRGQYWRRHLEERFHLPMLNYKPFWKLEGLDFLRYSMDFAERDYFLSESKVEPDSSNSAILPLPNSV